MVGEMELAKMILLLTKNKAMFANGYGYVQCRQTCTKLNMNQKLMNIDELKYEAVNKALHIADVSGSAVLNMDCIDVMKQIPDNFFNLAIVDPPYGLKIAKNGKLKANSKFDRGFKKDIDYGVKDWDNNVPTEEYWRELFRVSKNQIVWGGNFFLEYLGNTKCYVTWFKKGKDKNHRFSPTEWAWTSFDKKPM